MTPIADQIGPLIPALRRYARALLRDATAADDLVQDCLERALSNWGKRRSDGPVKPWLFTLLHNLGVNRLRQSKRRGAHLALEDAPDLSYSRPASQEDGLRHRDLMRAVDSELSHAPTSLKGKYGVEGLSFYR